MRPAYFDCLKGIAIICVVIFPYVREAYDNKKYAFVSDVARLYALYTEGGIYLDTDVELLSSFDKFLSYKSFFGFESQTRIQTSVLAAEKGSQWAQDNLEIYSNRHFVNDKGSFDLTPNVDYITLYLSKNGLIMNNEYQEICDGIKAFPTDYFSPKSIINGKINVTHNSVAIHHYDDSWHTPFEKLKIRIAKSIGPTLTKIVVSAKHWVLGNK